MLRSLRLIQNFWSLHTLSESTEFLLAFEYVVLLFFSTWRTMMGKASSLYIHGFGASSPDNQLESRCLDSLAFQQQDVIFKRPTT